ncbi:hypothetical protein BJ138DRAFT_1231765, partial [Hygrophoropsis aurantiaca]
YLQELLRHESRGGPSSDFCGLCEAPAPQYRCEDCFGFDMYCSGCILTLHAHNPLHRLKRWAGEFFESATLKSLGLRIQLGHKISTKCANPKQAFGDDFVVIDSNGIHEVGLDFCNCETAVEYTKQLLRMSWFPATSIDPKSAATFRVLEGFHLLSFESKASSYEFYHALARLTENTGLSPLKDRYEAFLRMIREWRHLKMLKRAGRGHVEDGVDTTTAGQCAVLCPACPQPGKNLPDGWQDAPLEKRWLYSLFVAIDANFRLKRKIVSKDSVDPSLGKGWAYFVEETAYKLHLIARQNDPQEVRKSTCLSHSAVNDAETKDSRGLAATGVGAVDCARHNMKLPNGVGDLQKGERYANMDYIFFSSIWNFPVDFLNISYDIACQWHKNLWKRMENIPSALRLDYQSKSINFLVPKFHLPAHVDRCQTNFSFNFVPGVGRTDGEAIERGWANINPVASSTKEMGPGNRRDTLDDHFGDWNWKKVVNLGPSILRKIKEAVPERNNHVEDFKQLEANLSAESIAEWTAEVTAWEANHSARNPFAARVDVLSLHAVRLQLAKDDAQMAKDESSPALHPDITPSILISAGLDLEEQQRRLHTEFRELGVHATDNQKAKFIQRSTGITRRIDAWRKVQLLYMPIVASLRSRSNDSVSSTEEIEKPEDINLWLPSKITQCHACDMRLRNIEWDLRYAQAHDALNELRQTLRLQTAMYKYKDHNITGQGPGTRIRESLKKIEHRLRASARKYRDARTALLALSSHLGKVGWQDNLRPLQDDDIKPATYNRLETTTTTEGRRRLTWIWLIAGESEDGNKKEQDAVRVEWCKARSRAMRWSEEVELLFEEKRRTLKFLDWQAKWWTAHANVDWIEDPLLKEGALAYAHRQASLRRKLAASGKVQNI